MRADQDRASRTGQNTTPPAARCGFAGVVESTVVMDRIVRAWWVFSAGLSRTEPAGPC